MADEPSNFEIKIATQYDGAGAKAAQADLAKTAETAAAPVAGGAVGEANAAKAQARLDAYAAKVAASDTQQISAAAEKLALEERRALVILNQARVAATMAGDRTELLKIQAEMAARRATLGILQTEGITEQEINEALVARNALIAEGTAAVTAQITAEEAQAAAETGHLHGRAGHLGHLAENFGLSSNHAISMGMGVMFGMEAYRLIQDATKELEKQTAEREKQGKELSEQLHKNHEDLENARSLSDVAAVRERIEKQLTDLHEKRFEIDLLGSAEEKEAIDNRINALNNELRIAATWPATNLERKNAEEQVAESINTQTKALEDQLGKYKEEVSEIKEKLKFENELADMKLKERLLKIKQDEDDGKISHEKAAQLRAAASGKADDDKFQREQAAKKEEMDKAGVAKTFAENMASAQAAALASAKMHFKAAQDQLSKNAIASIEAAKANEAAKNASDAAAWSEEGSAVLGGPALNLEATRKAKKETARAAAEAAKKVLPANHVAQLKADAESQKKQIEDLEKAREKFEKEAQAAAEDYAKKKKAFDTEAPRVSLLQQNRVVVRNMEDRSKRVEATKRDQEERERQQKEDERDHKTETPDQLTAEIDRIREKMSSTASSIHHPGSTREPLKVVNLKREIDSLMAAVKSNPNDKATQNQLDADINELAKLAHTMVTALEKSGVQTMQIDMNNLKAAQRRMEDWIKNQRMLH